MVVSSGYVLFVVCKQGLTGAQDSFHLKVTPRPTSRGWHRAPFLFSAGASSTNPKPSCAAICRIHYLIRIAPAERPPADGIGMCGRHILYGTAAGNIIPATTVAPKYGNGSPVPVSGINFSYRIDHKKITDAAAIRLNSSKNSVKLRHYHVEYHRIRFIIRLLAPLSTATRRGNIIKFSRNSSCFQQNTSMQYDFCIFAESTLRTMPVPDTDLHHRFFRTRTSPNVTGIVLFYFRYVEFWWKSLYYAELYQQIIVSGQRTISNHQYPLIIRNQDERNIMKTWIFLLFLSKTFRFLVGKRDGPRSVHGVSRNSTAIAITITIRPSLSFFYGLLSRFGNSSITTGR